eukprot:5214624-Pyramimonas_sp.AAC.1
MLSLFLSPCQAKTKKPTACALFWTYQLDATDDGARNRAQYSLVWHQRYDRGRSHKVEYRQRNAPT